jgi:hypothetical protein
VTFAVDGLRGKFVSMSPPTRIAAKEWAVGRTSIQFFVLRHVQDESSLVPVYGINAQGHQLRSLSEDIQFHNAGVTVWPGVMALALGVLGLTVAAVRWHQKNAA